MPNHVVEILIYQPNPNIPAEDRGVHENLWIMQQAERYLSIGVFLDSNQLKYYYFKDCDDSPRLYDALVSLKKDLPPELKDLFDTVPKLYIMGHGHGGLYGLANQHGSSEVIYDDHFDQIMKDCMHVLPVDADNVSITLETCSTDDQALAAEKNQQKTFLARLSENFPQLTVSGTGPWDARDAETGYRASGGFPQLNVPITSMVGGIWKHGNSVIFYHGSYQVRVKKSMFASTQSAKAVKINTLKYARILLEKSDLDRLLMASIAADRTILTIADLTRLPEFCHLSVLDEQMVERQEYEKSLLRDEQSRYIEHVQRILSADARSERDVLILTLGLKEPSVFEGYDDIRDALLNNRSLLSLCMVACGKVLIAGKSNDGIIDLLISHDIDINSTDEHGMTALHYAVQNFFNYRQEPLALIQKLIACGANLQIEDNMRRTPLMLADAHCQKSTVLAGKNLLDLLQQKISARLMANTELAFFPGKKSTKKVAAQEHASQLKQGFLENSLKNSK